MASDRAARTRIRVLPVELRDLPTGLFMAGALIAPVDLRLVGAFTLYDMILLSAAFVILVHRRTFGLPLALLSPALIFLLVALISTVRATNPVEALTQLAQFVFVFAIQLPVTFSVIKTRRTLYMALAFFIAGSVAGIGISWLAGAAGGAGRMTAFFSDNPNRLGYPIVYLLPIILVYLEHLRMIGARLKAVVVGAVLIYPLLWALLASATRGGALAAAVSFLLYTVFRDGLRRAPVRLLGATACVLMLVLLVRSTTIFPETLRDRVDRTFSDDPVDAHSLVSDRANLASAAMLAIRDSPLIGTGLDNFRFEARWYDQSSTDQAPHNLWLGLLAQTGVAGAFAYAVLLVVWYEMVTSMRATASNLTDHRLAWAFVASMTGVMVILMTTPVMVHRHVWLLFGLGMCLYLIHYRNANLAPARPQGLRRMLA